MYKPISTALLSFGMSGRIFHAPLLTAHDGFSLDTILQFEPNDAGKHYPKAKLVTKFEDILSDKDIELVIVNTPNATHVDYALRALEAGKHVIVEKPFALTTSEGEELLAMGKKMGKVVTAFHNRRWDGDFRTVQKVLSDKQIVGLVEYEAHYDRFRNYIDGTTWKEEAGKGTGSLYLLGPHLIDQALTLFGMPNYVDARMGVQREGGKVDDFFDIRLEYDSHFAILKSSYLVREEGPRYILHGNNGTFLKYGIDPQEEALKNGAEPGAPPHWGKEPKEMWGKLNAIVNGNPVNERIETIPGNYLHFYESIYQTIRNNAPLIVKSEESLNVVRVTDAVFESSKTRKAIPMKK